MNVILAFAAVSTRLHKILYEKGKRESKRQRQTERGRGVVREGGRGRGWRRKEERERK